MSNTLSIGIGKNIGVATQYVLPLKPDKMLSQFGVKNIRGIGINNPTPATIAVYERRPQLTAMKRIPVIVEDAALKFLQPSPPIIICPPFSYVAVPVASQFGEYVVYEGDYVADLASHPSEAQIILFDDVFTPCAVQYRVHSQLTIADPFTNALIPVSGSQVYQMPVGFSMGIGAKNTLYYLNQGTAPASVVLQTTFVKATKTAIVVINPGITAFPNGFLYDMPNRVAAWDLTAYSGLETLQVLVTNGAGGTIAPFIYVESEFRFH